MNIICHTLRHRAGIFDKTLLMCGFLCFLLFCSGCSDGQSNKANRDVYIYVFSRDYDAKVNPEWLATQEDGPETLVAKTFEKNTWISMNKQPEDGLITISSQNEKFDVEPSVLSLLSPEQYQAAINGETDSPHYLRNLDNFLESHNVLLLSDGTTPAPTAQSADTDFLYICIPAILLLIIGFICSKMEEGSLLLPSIGAVLMISQIIIFFVVIGGTGVNIRAPEIFILAAIIPALLVMAANVYSGLQMSGAVLRHYNIEFGLKPVLLCIGIGIAACWISTYAIDPLFGITDKKSMQYAWAILTCYGIGILAGSLCFFGFLYRRNPASCKAAPLIILIFLLTALFGALLLFIYFVIWLWKMTHNVFIKPGGNMLGSSQRNCCTSCRLYNPEIQQCSKTLTRIDDPNMERNCCQL